MQFKDIHGQEIIKQRLIDTVKENRVSHAQLFYGPEGCGKLALAIAYAQYINCEDKHENDSCGLCSSCVKYNKYAHPDLHFIFPSAPLKNQKNPNSLFFIREWRELLIEKNAYISLNAWHQHIGIENKQSNIYVKDCNEIIKTISLKSYESEFKIMIIWMAEKINHSAAPRILKILEEPPDKTLFILVSEDREMIIKTILSRTQQIKIPPINASALSSYLQTKCTLSEDKLSGIVQLAEGNIVKGLELCEDDENEHLHFSTFRDWMRLCFRPEMEKLLPFIDKLAGLGRENQKLFLNYSLRIIRECMLHNFNIQELNKLMEYEAEFTSKFSQFIHSGNVVALYEIINESVYHIERNAHPKILFTDLSLNMSKLLRPK